MSRIGKKPVAVPARVKVAVDGRRSRRRRAAWASSKQSFLPLVAVQFDDGGKRIVVTRKSETRQAKAVHGLTRALIHNMVDGVTKGYEKKLEIVGVGYLAAVQKNHCSCASALPTKSTCRFPPA